MFRWLLCTLFLFFFVYHLYSLLCMKNVRESILLLIDLLSRVELQIKSLFFFSTQLVLNCNFKQKAGQQIFFNLIKIKLLDSTSTFPWRTYWLFSYRLVYCLYIYICVWCRTFSMVFFLIGMWSRHLLYTVYYLFELKSQLFSNPLFRLHPKSIYTVFALYL